MWPSINRCIKASFLTTFSGFQWQAVKVEILQNRTPLQEQLPSEARLYSGSRGCGFFFPGDSTWLSSGYCYDAHVDTAIHWPHCIINQDVVTLMCTDRKGWVVGLKLMQQNVFLVSVSRGFLISYFSPSYHGTLFFYFPLFFHRLKLYHRVQPPSGRHEVAQLSGLFYISNADHIINPVVTHFLTGARASTSLQLSSGKMWISFKQSCSSAAQTCSPSICFKYVYRYIQIYLYIYM